MPALLALALAALYALWRSGFFAHIRSVEELQTMIASAGAWSGAAYFLIQVLSVILMPIPSNVTMMAGALVLGFRPAVLLGVLAITLGSLLVFLAARRLGRNAVQRFVDHGVMEKYLPVIEEKQDMFLFLTMLFPFFPDDALCILAGLTSIPTARFALIVVSARPWGLIVAALLGSGALSLPAWAWAALVVLLAPAFYFAMKYSAQIEHRLFEAFERIGRKRRHADEKDSSPSGR